MLRPEAVVVADDAAGLGAVPRTKEVKIFFGHLKIFVNTLLVNHVGFVRQVRQLHALLLDVEQVGVGVKVVQAVGVHLPQLLEVDHSFLYLSGQKYFLYSKNNWT